MPKKKITVYLAERELEASEDGKVKRKCDCLIGREGHETTPGTYRVLLKQIDKRSKKYDAPMNFSLKFSSDWKAIHETSNFLFRNIGMSLGIDASGSHGCVGVAHDDAKWLFEWAEIGTPIFVVLARG